MGDSFGAPQELLCLVGSACILYMYCVVYISYIVTVYLLKYGVHKYSMPMHSFTQKTCFSARSARSGYEGYPNWE